eukprot:3225677-Prymnesium_polylepis.1
MPPKASMRLHRTPRRGESNARAAAISSFVQHVPRNRLRKVWLAAQCHRDCDSQQRAIRERNSSNTFFNEYANSGRCEETDR